VFSFEHKVTENERRVPIGKILSARLPEISQIRLKRLILDGQVRINDTTALPTYRGIVGDLISISVDEPITTAMSPEHLPLTIVFEDDEMLVVDKPAGLLVHPSNSQKSGTLLNAVCHHLKSNGQPNIRPGLVHRLDRNTSGLIVLAKTERTHRTLAKQFTNHWIEKKYLGLTVGHLPDNTGTIDADIGSDKLKFPHWRVMEDGKTAVTVYRVLQRLVSTPKSPDSAPGNFTVVELLPMTGRTNQLRIHLAHIGFPLVNDYVYGRKENEAAMGHWSQSSTTSRHFLHASELRFRHPLSGEWFTLNADLPEDMREFISNLRRLTDDDTNADSDQTRSEMLD
jgi:23S rRNA pseudouridine1911/1915/1917 synthase